MSVLKENPEFVDFLDRLLDRAMHILNKLNADGANTKSEWPILMRHLYDNDKALVTELHRTLTQKNEKIYYASVGTEKAPQPPSRLLYALETVDYPRPDMNGEEDPLRTLLSPSVMECVTKTAAEMEAIHAEINTATDASQQKVNEMLVSLGLPTSIDRYLSASDASAPETMPEALSAMLEDFIAQGGVNILLEKKTYLATTREGVLALYAEVDGFITR
ncbi:hypothetical protein KIPB_010966 [Kipferlia bialata]|uniref:Uncharacterized protein n=1 Tax=Kipferlia bialata TaxID=797122 RepID=A0A9K3GNC3_9EUKA|nr:hypothetical protein KIPB_010966 [Kipferlia bialata]|eukprot:g10966.t1